MNNRYEELPKFPGDYLYKYLSTANQTPHWHDRFNQLMSGIAYLPSPKQFNDPFDCRPFVDTPDSVEVLEAHRPAFIERLIAAAVPPGVDPTLARKILATNLAATSPEKFKEVVRTSAMKSADEMGVFCLAENIENVLMWSHYANNHCGIALRFDMRNDIGGGLMPIFKVTYEEERPNLSTFYSGTPSGSATDALRTKAKFWEYEQEWRSLHVGEAGSLAKFNPSIIDAVVFGANTSSEDEAWVREALASRPTKMQRAIPDDRTFKLRIVDC